jgi:hypothetical protein
MRSTNEDQSLLLKWISELRWLTGVRFLVELARDPLDGELLADEDRRTEEEGEKEIRDEVEGILCTGMDANDRMERDPNRERPRTERHITE